MSGAGLVLANAALVLLGVAAALCLVRAGCGPSPLDRIVALDLFLVVLVAAAAVRTTATQGRVPLMLLVVLSLLGFAGSATAARLVERRPR